MTDFHHFKVVMNSMGDLKDGDLDKCERVVSLLERIKALGLVK